MVLLSCLEGQASRALELHGQDSAAFRQSAMLEDLGLNQYQVITAKVQGYLVSVKPKPITIMFEAIVSGNKFYYRLDFIQRKH